MIDIERLARGIVFAGIDRETPLEELPQFGGYVLFGRDDPSVADVRRTTDGLRERTAPEPPPVIGIDQEGGRVVRLRRDVEPMPSMMALGAVDDLELTSRAGEQVAFDLRRAGCTIDFAPVLDLALRARNTAIGTRSLGANPERVAELGAAFGRGLASGGIAPCYKHFPGHGDTEDDSHVSVPSIDATDAALRERDLTPFARVAARAPAIMTGHVIVRAIDANDVASASSAVTDLLRSLDFGGVCITDCLTMAGAGVASEAAIRALYAGADAVIVSRPVAAADEVVAAVVRAVANGALTLQRLTQAYDRVTRLRAAATEPIAVEAFPPHPGIGREIARRAVTLIRGLAHVDPLTSMAISFEGATVDGIAPDAFSRPSLRSESPALAQATLPLDCDAGALAPVFERLTRSGRRPVV
ncbi:MAG TPA: glycoside hydrolase family 3 N-terminal domain-containing protein, partial [Candidatus Tumulicola sp.]